MKIEEFSGMDVRENRWAGQKNACQIAVNTVVDRGKLQAVGGNIKINSTSYGSPIMGLYQYRPKGSVGGLVRVVDDGTVTSSDPLLGPTIDLDINSVYGTSYAYNAAEFTLVGSTLYFRWVSNDQVMRLIRRDGSASYTEVATFPDCTGTGFVAGSVEQNIASDGSSVYALGPFGTGETALKWDGSWNDISIAGFTPYWLSSKSGAIYVCGSDATAWGCHMYTGGAWVDMGYPFDYTHHNPVLVIDGTDIYAVARQAYGDGNLYVVKFDSGTTWNVYASATGTVYNPIKVSEKLNGKFYIQTQTHPIGGDINVFDVGAATIVSFSDYPTYTVYGWIIDGELSANDAIATYAYNGTTYTLLFTDVRTLVTKIGAEYISCDSGVIYTGT